MSRLKNEEPTKQDNPITKGIGKIEEKPITIIGYKEFKGKASLHTNKEDIDSDGNTQYWVITTKESFEIDGEKVSNFFITKATKDQLKDEGVEEKIESEDYLRVEVYKFKGKKSEYWYFRNPKPTQKEIA